MKRTAKISIFFIILFVISNAFAFELRYHHSLSGQRRDGSKLFDITYELYDLGATDSVNIFVWTITQSGETLAYCTPTYRLGTFSGDIGTVIGSGVKHITWNIGIDAPDREFYSDSIVIQLAAAMIGVLPGWCGKIYVMDSGHRRIVRIDDMTGAGWISYGIPDTAGFVQPIGIAVTHEKIIYVADRGNHRIFRIEDMTGTEWLSLSGFDYPYDIAESPDGKIYVLERDNYRIVRIDDMTGAGWITYGSAGSDSGQFNIPRGIAIGPDEKIYIADCSNYRIVRIDDMMGTGWITYGTLGFGEGEFYHPFGIDVAPDGKIYVADYDNNRIVRINNMTGSGWVSLAGFSYPTDIAVAPDGKIYVTEFDNCRIVRVDDMTGAGWIDYGVEGSGIGEFNHPYGIAVAPW